MKHRVLASAMFAMVVLLTYGPEASAAGFDCAKATTAIEQAICGDPTLSKLDDEMTAIYRQAITIDPTVRQQQTDWLRGTRNQCKTYECLGDAYRVRIQNLSKFVQPAVAQVPVQPGEAALAVGVLELGCPVDWTRLYALTDGDEEKLIFGIKAGLWTKALVDQVLARSEGCLRTSRDPVSLRQAAWSQLHDVDYPNTVAVLDRRDQHRQAAIEKREAERREAELAAAREHEARVLQQQQEKEEARQRAERQRSNNLLIVLAVIAVAIGGWVWNRFFRNRCPKCRSTSYDTVTVSETDRWRGTKAVTEQHSRGTRTRHVSVTKVKKLYEYRCRNCQQEWSKEKTEELR